eukprot:9566963-Alexandrium_andersonii.AAC.1
MWNHVELCWVTASPRSHLTCFPRHCCGAVLTVCLRRSVRACQRARCLSCRAFASCATVVCQGGGRASVAKAGCARALLGAACQTVQECHHRSEIPHGTEPGGVPPDRGRYARRGHPTDATCACAVAVGVGSCSALLGNWLTAYLVVASELLDRRRALRLSDGLQSSCRLQPCSCSNIAQVPKAFLKILQDSSEDSPGSLQRTQGVDGQTSNQTRTHTHTHTLHD